MPNAKILVVDDEPSILKLVTAYLQSEGYDYFGDLCVVDVHIGHLRSPNPAARLCGCRERQPAWCPARRVLSLVNPAYREINKGVVMLKGWLSECLPFIKRRTGCEIWCFQQGKHNPRGN